jgi:LysM repeat protein
MFKKAIIIIAIAIAVVLLFSACERTASQPLKATPTEKSTNPTAQPTGLNVVQEWATSTAEYVQTMVATGAFTAVPASVTAQASLTPTPLGTVSTPSSSTQVPPTGAAPNTPLPGTTPVVIVPTATPGRPATYTLQSGEFPYCIARRFNVDPDDLLSRNGLGSGQILQPGLVLQIPQTGSFPGTRALNAHPAQYTVAVDDTIYRIACHFGDVDPSSIAAANGIALSTKLTTGKILNIP